MAKEFLINFKEICSRRGIAPSTALKKAGLSNSLYTKWSNSPGAVPNLTTLKKIAEVLHVSVDELCYGDFEPIGLTDLRNYPALQQLLRCRNKLTQTQMDEILRYAKYIAPGAFDDLQKL